MIPALLFFGCKKDEDKDPNDPDGSCYVHLYDGDNFTDDNVIVKGPAEFSSLKRLPNSNKDWSDEADALKVGPNTTVTIWSEEDFKGESATFQAGAEEPDLDHEPRSMKITCNK